MNGKDQRGFVSIIVASILMVLVSLVALGLTTLMQREQRQALDRQLSAQAFYAAETGVNDYINAVKNIPSLVSAEEKEVCDVSTGWNNGVVRSDQPEDVRYTCLIYDQTPGNLIFKDKITTTTSEIFPIEEEGGAAINFVTLEWNGSQESQTINDSCNFPSSYNSTDIPVLRLDLIEVPDSFTRDDLQNKTASFYFIPHTSGACGATDSVSFDSGLISDGGQVKHTRCATVSSCSITVNGLTGARYYARVKSIYNNVGTLNVVSASDFEFRNAQTIVDVTGKATDVLRRIEVRLSQRPRYDLPEAVFQSDKGFCKLIGKYGSNITNEDCY